MGDIVEKRYGLSFAPIKNNKDILDETLSISQRYLDKAENSIAEINEEVNKELIFIMNRLARREY